MLTHVDRNQRGEKSTFYKKIHHELSQGFARRWMRVLLPLWASVQDKESSNDMKQMKHVLAIGAALLLAMASAVPLAEAGHAGHGGGAFGGFGGGGGGGFKSFGGGGGGGNGHSYGNYGHYIAMPW